MVNIVNNLPVEFADYKFDLVNVKNVMNNFGYFNARPITKAMLTWWAYTMQEQSLYSLETPLEIEHIYAKNRNEKENTLSDPRNVELLGNKALLEKKINIRASDYRFADKAIFYKGFINKRKQNKEGTKIIELVKLADTKVDFTEKDIKERNTTIINTFLAFLKDNDLSR